MKPMMLGAFAISALIAVPLGLASVANAADLPLKAPPPVACAGNTNIVRANNQIGVDYAAHSLDYLEYATGFIGFVGPAAGLPFDSEKGWQSGIDVFGSAMRNIGPFCNLYVFGEGSYFSGTTAYWASGGPVTSNTDGAKIWDGDFRLGEGFNLSPTMMLTPYLGGGFHTWNRDLTGAFGLNEDYHHGYVGGGMLLQFDVSPRSCCPSCCGSSGGLVLSAYGLMGSTVDPYMQASPNGGAAVVPTTYPLQSQFLAKAGASADFAFTEHLHANAGLDWTYFTYGVSPTEPPAGAVEPNSRTSELKVKAGLGFGW